eukprot:CAMPEP_0174259490 /NCGR_PEP_ID=MMETSP0439-20130205/8304_1 /TAXON_ID=0 /ORGANISM="Stereomyxa ramosa, Strain Chinc5" /LENGTH=378 /DNA_ID=CAMNT_0015343391 /DNA_START=197 /DNA_END=1330 /DNA_ORIENTATION=+
MGFNGSGVVISLVDDGLQYDHVDLTEPSSRYRSDLSYDFNDDDYYPINSLYSDTHGTSCGALAFGGDNDKCGIGIAYQAEFSCQRVIAKASTDAQEAAALSYKTNLNDIYTNSWGPMDNGRHLSGPGYLTAQAIQQNCEQGRQGKGNIYVWAGGNGYQHQDNVNYDGYANMRYTIAVGAITNQGKASPYSEPGAALVVVSPSSPTGIRTAAVNDKCTTTFGGTSAASPMVAGVIALMLQANPELGWRDVQHILITTAIKNDLGHWDWVKNGANLYVNHQYGFGLVDAEAAVRKASNYTILEEESNITLYDNKDLQSLTDFKLVIEFQITTHLIVEHVEIYANITGPFGRIKIELVSPSGTRSLLNKPHVTGDDSSINW